MNRLTRFWTRIAALLAAALALAPMRSPAPPELPDSGEYLLPPGDQYLGQFQYAGGYQLNLDLAGVAGALGSLSSPQTFTLPGTATLLGLPGGPYSGSVSAQVLVTPTGTGVFDTEMTALDLSGLSLPTSDQIRLDPNTPAPGQTTLTDTGGGNFQINSFFDIFTDLSIDGGQMWIPQQNGPTTTGPLPVPLTSVPEQAPTFAMLALGVLSLAGVRARLRRQAG